MEKHLNITNCNECPKKGILCPFSAIPQAHRAIFCPVLHPLSDEDKAIQVPPGSKIVIKRQLLEYWLKERVN